MHEFHGLLSRARPLYDLQDAVFITPECVDRPHRGSHDSRERDAIRPPATAQCIPGEANLLRGTFHGILLRKRRRRFTQERALIISVRFPESYVPLLELLHVTSGERP